MLVAHIAYFGTAGVMCAIAEYTTLEKSKSQSKIKLNNFSVCCNFNMPRMILIQLWIIIAHNCKYNTFSSCDPWTMVKGTINHLSPKKSWRIVHNLISSTGIYKRIDLGIPSILFSSPEDRCFLNYILVIGYIPLTLLLKMNIKIFFIRTWKNP